MSRNICALTRTGLVPEGFCRHPWTTHEDARVRIEPCAPLRPPNTIWVSARAGRQAIRASRARLAGRQYVCPPTVARVTSIAFAPVPRRSAGPRLALGQFRHRRSSLSAELLDGGRRFSPPKVAATALPSRRPARGWLAVPSEAVRARLAHAVLRFDCAMRLGVE